jgi:hypothetical protein
MTSNKHPTSPGWWWVKDRRGRIMAVEIAMHEGELCMLTSTMYPWPISATDDEWLGPVLSHEEGQRLQEENRILRGTIDAQDEREQRAGVACGVPYELSTCDWPDAVADEVLALRQRIADLESQQAQWDGPVQSRVEAYKRHVMGIVDHVHGQEGIASDYYGDGWKDACDEIRMNLEAKAGEA